MESSSILYEHNLYSLSLFHLQQASEKTAKGLWIVDLLPSRYSMLEKDLLRNHDFLTLISKSIRLNENNFHQTIKENPSFVLNSLQLSVVNDAPHAFGECGLYRSALTTCVVPLYGWLSNLNVAGFATKSFEEAMKDESEALDRLYENNLTDNKDVLKQLCTSDIFIKALARQDVRKKIAESSHCELVRLIETTLSRVADMNETLHSGAELSDLKIWVDTYVMSLMLAIVTQCHESSTRYPISDVQICPSAYDEKLVGISAMLPLIINLSQTMICKSEKLLSS
ncbi:MAG: HEPN domain-containing protein [Nitrososphaerota archaeon]|nr:HEPN domain-containing protein [Nitrososphaerota archaeon]